MGVTAPACVSLLVSSVSGITLGFDLRFPEGTAKGKGVVVVSFPRNLGVG